MFITGSPALADETYAFRGMVLYYGVHYGTSVGGCTLQGLYILFQKGMGCVANLVMVCISLHVCSQSQSVFSFDSI